jgi:hypothetical protein
MGLRVFRPWAGSCRVMATASSARAVNNVSNVIVEHRLLASGRFIRRSNRRASTVVKTDW